MSVPPPGKPAPGTPPAARPAVGKTPIPVPANASVRPPQAGAPAPSAPRAADHDDILDILGGDSDADLPAVKPASRPAAGAAGSPVRPPANPARPVAGAAARPPAGKPTSPIAVPGLPDDGPEIPDSVTDDEIANMLGQPSRPHARVEPKVFTPGAAKPGAGSVSGTLSQSAEERAASDRNRARIAALTAQLGGGPAKPAAPKTVADSPAKVGMMFLFTGVKEAEAAWAGVPADQTKGVTKQVKAMAANGGPAQMFVVSATTPRKLMLVVRALKDAGGKLRQHKADNPEVQTWLDDHVK